MEEERERNEGEGGREGGRDGEGELRRRQRGTEGKRDGECREGGSDEEGRVLEWSQIVIMLEELCVTINSCSCSE